jgi:formate hydrogenlyase subunit 6/NADH:ubiquinone oxidoreductase subunit I
MEVLRISKQDFNEFVGKLIAGAEEVVGVVKKGDQFSFEVLDTADDLCLNYDVTILPPKKYFLPVQDAILSFKTKDPASYQATPDTRPRIILGLHPEDLAAIQLLDKIHQEGQTDQHYLARRRSTILVGMYHTLPSKYRFASSMLKDSQIFIADAMLVDLNDGTYGVEVYTEKGAELMKKGKVQTGDASLTAAIEAKKYAVKDKLTLAVDKENLPAFLEGKEKHPVWEARAKKCFSCGSCVLVCPTCYCFDVQDELDLSLATGHRLRTWDGCTIDNFALAAGGHNFRGKPADRLRHRLFRKGKYIKERFGLSGCVGCGRCAKACVADIANPVEIIGELKEKEA